MYIISIHSNEHVAAGGQYIQTKICACQFILNEIFAECIVLCNRKMYVKCL
jgi:hypothetical protein